MVRGLAMACVSGDGCTQCIGIVRKRRAGILQAQPMRDLRLHLHLPSVTAHPEIHDIGLAHV